MSTFGSSEVDPHMRVYEDRVEFVDEEGVVEVHRVGTQTHEANDRYERIKRELDAGYLRSMIDDVHNIDRVLDMDVEERYRSLIDGVVDSITGERGRAIAGLLVMQMAIKAIAPQQSIRLHKGSRSSAHFGWEEGISMRTIDNTYVTPLLREYGLLRLNKDGVMMTRSLAENYPYSRFYQANIRGAQDEWAELVEAIESPDATLEPRAGLAYLITSLVNRGDEAQEVIEAALTEVGRLLDRGLGGDQVLGTIKGHIERSPHSARIFEVALHSLMQVEEDLGLLDGQLKPLTQMRSADKKHGNVADIEVVRPGDEFHVFRAWDAKHGRTHMVQELGELEDKLRRHPETEMVGFVTSSDPVIDDEVRGAIDRVQSRFDVTIEIESFDAFCSRELAAIVSGGAREGQWLRAYAETLAHERRDRAPIDEPTQAWLELLIDEVNDRL